MPIEPVEHAAEGLTMEAAAYVDRRVRIEMAPGVDSVNVAAAGAIAMYVCTSAASVVAADKRGSSGSQASTRVD